MTVFAKTNGRDRAQVARAKKAMLACIEAKRIANAFDSTLSVGLRPKAVA